MSPNDQTTQPSEPEYRLIPLTQGQFAKVDLDDYDWLSRWKWHAHWSPDTQSFYARRNALVNEPRSPSTILMHRVIKGIVDETKIDHFNHDTLDNRRDNLRLCTHAQNAHNSGIRKSNTSGYKGVNWHKVSQKWQARIRANGVCKQIGLFASVEEAAEAYRKAATELHGDFAKW